MRWRKQLLGVISGLLWHHRGLILLGVLVTNGSGLAGGPLHNLEAWRSFFPGGWSTVCTATMTASVCTTSPNQSHQCCWPAGPAVRFALVLRISLSRVGKTWPTLCLVIGSRSCRFVGRVSCFYTGAFPSFPQKPLWLNVSVPRFQSPRIKSLKVHRVEYVTER